MRNQHLLILVMVGAGLGLFFSGFSTYDFAQHLDRQVHSVHCSFIPGLAALDASGASGCQVALMSPFSSVLRSGTWGGIPIALPSMSVFAFLFFFALELHWSGRLADRRALGFLVLAAALPSLVSVLMAYVALATLGTLCKLCIGIYVASFLALGASFVLWRRAPHRALDDEDDGPTPTRRGYSDGPVAIGDDGAEMDASEPGRPSPAAPRRPAIVSNAYLAGAFAAGIFFVALPVLAYVAAVPDHDPFITDCGVLNDPHDRYDVMIDLDGTGGEVGAVELLDPLCPACAAFELRLERYARLGELKRQALLFPLDNSCNWMVDSAIHPGACTVSEALLCAGEHATEVLAWAFQEQERIRTESADDPGAAKRIVLEKFPELRRCIGSANVRSKLNKSLRWAVGNRLQILTPQLFVAGVKLCDEDLDLGLDYALGLLLNRHAAGTLPKPPRRPSFVRTPAESGGAGGGAGGDDAAGDTEADLDSDLAGGGNDRAEVRDGDEDLDADDGDDPELALPDDIGPGVDDAEDQAGADDPELAPPEPEDPEPDPEPEPEPEPMEVPEPTGGPQ